LISRSGIPNAQQPIILSCSLRIINNSSQCLRLQAGIEVAEILDNDMEGLIRRYSTTATRSSSRFGIKDSDADDPYPDHHHHHHQPHAAVALQPAQYDPSCNHTLDAVELLLGAYGSSPAADHSRNQQLVTADSAVPASAAAAAAATDHYMQMIFSDSCGRINLPLVGATGTDFAAADDHRPHLGSAAADRASGRSSSLITSDSNAAAADDPRLQLLHYYYYYYHSSGQQHHQLAGAPDHHHQQQQQQQQQQFSSHGGDDADHPAHAADQGDHPAPLELQEESLQQQQQQHDEAQAQQLESGGIMSSWDDEKKEMEEEEDQDHPPLPPGFRFHPTDEELVGFYLASKIRDASFRDRAVAEADLNKLEPWELPGKQAKPKQRKP
jgi:hypothetical protein